MIQQFLSQEKYATTQSRYVNYYDSHLRCISTDCQWHLTKKTLVLCFKSTARPPTTYEWLYPYHHSHKNDNSCEICSGSNIVRKQLQCCRKPHTMQVVCPYFTRFAHTRKISLKGEQCRSPSLSPIMCENTIVYRLIRKTQIEFIKVFAGLGKVLRQSSKHLFQNLLTREGCPVCVLMTAEYLGLKNRLVWQEIIFTYFNTKLAILCSFATDFLRLHSRYSPICQVWGVKPLPKLTSP